jgi:hypothetical protein
MEVLSSWLEKRQQNSCGAKDPWAEMVASPTRGRLVRSRGADVKMPLIFPSANVSSGGFR